MMSTFYIKTLGCKTNFFDSNCIANELSLKGWKVEKDFKNANMIIINSCCVTHKAEKEALYLLRFYKKNNPDAFLVLCGCYAQIGKEFLLKHSELDLIINNEQKINNQISNMILEEYYKFQNQQDKFIKKQQIDNVKDDNIKNANIPTDSAQNIVQFKTQNVFFGPSFSQTRSRAFVKIQDGCDSFCSYCIIPYARGSSRSVRMELVLKEIDKLVKNNIKEIVISGIHIGYYGQDFKAEEANRVSLKTLLNNIFTNVDGQYRIRLSSLEPNEIDEELLNILKQNSNKFCDHFHVPLQSGSDKILSLMNRKYTTVLYKNVINLIRQYFPYCNIGTDIIVGFPQESDTDFDITYEFINNINLNYLHVFPYSDRRGTLAAQMPNKVRSNVIKSRVRSLLGLSRELIIKYAKSFIGKQVEVLWEKIMLDNKTQQGTTRNYLNAIRYNKIQSGMVTNEIVKNILIKEQDACLII